MAHQVWGNEYVLSFVIQGKEGLEEKYAENADDIREVLRDAYMLSARNKEEVHIYLQAFIERNSVSFGHRVTVLPGDTDDSLETGYSATVYMCNENEASIEDVIETLRKTLATSSADAPPSERWLAVVAGLTRTFGKEAVDTKIALESQIRADGITTDIIYEIKGRTAWTGNDFGFHGTDDMHLRTVAEEIRVNVALMEEKLRRGSDGQIGDPVSSVRFWYHTHGIRWGVLVSFLYGGHTKITAQNDGVNVETCRGNAIMTIRMPPVSESFVFTRESWERALCTAISVISADITSIEEHLGKNKWGKPSLLILPRGEPDKCSRSFTGKRND